MVLILTKDIDPSTNTVIKWLDYFKIEWFRIDSLKIDDKRSIGVELGESQRKIFIENGDALDLNEIKAVWFRRYPWGYLRNNLNHTFKDLPNEVKERLVNHLANEQINLFKIMVSFFDGLPWLNYPNEKIKYVQYSKALKHGLKVPYTYIVSDKERLKQVMNNHARVITKPMSELFTTSYNDKTVVMSYTTVIEDSLIEELPNKFHPMMVQEYIEKNFELRVFFINGKFYGSAMFSQVSKQTSVDFRKYNFDDPTRTVPYELPKDICDKLEATLNEMRINCGSIDLIFGKDNNYYFLEVNPIGQYAMVSESCNYYLDRVIAEELIKMGRYYG